MANQAELRQSTSSFEYKYGISSAFTDFTKARARRMRVGSLGTLMRTATQATPAPEVATPHTKGTTNVQRSTAGLFVLPPNFGISLPKPRDLACPGFAKFTGNEIKLDI
ncbi:hypothetical protein F442_10825 [Phytophthora nicotianae P10297]|uniref:Uncharacterized protein n=2 Tax=Phytophthora nicotianae TaxID=4792 RepID=V9F0W0_PHYNI|nr:hypothetical protein F443_10928 [Phytophthora nicotianae P1569]ETP42256.1 hypothetical protein F442_10825 [Phytophthora nicotianae P10297]